MSHHRRNLSHYRGIVYCKDRQLEAPAQHPAKPAALSHEGIATDECDSSNRVWLLPEHKGPRLWLPFRVGSAKPEPGRPAFQGPGRRQMPNIDSLQCTPHRICQPHLQWTFLPPFLLSFSTFGHSTMISQYCTVDVSCIRILTTTMAASKIELF